MKNTGIACTNTILNRKYLQFNDLVIDNYDMLSAGDLSGGFKTTTEEYSFGHGSYAAFKAKQQFSAEQSLSLTLKLDTRKLRVEQKKFYKEYVWTNLVKAGRIWAIEGTQILWAYAFVKDFSESYATEKDIVNIDVDLILYEGVWHKADPKKVFLKPYTACNFMECLDLREADECQEDCLSCPPSSQEPCAKCACECDYLTKETSLCALQKEVSKVFYNYCGDSYQLIYNCEVGKKIWGTEKMLGHKICKAEACKDIIAGQFYSDTLLESDRVMLTLIGEVKNPVITVNGNTMQILGDYTGRVTLTASG